jgi:DNA-directed RNA polymerase specialized sigma24 family protein
MTQIAAASRVQGSIDRGTAERDHSDGDSDVKRHRGDSDGDVNGTQEGDTAALGEPLRSNIAFMLSDEESARLRRAFIARFGTQLADDIFAEAIAWAYEHAIQVQVATNRVGLLYRVGQSKSRRFLRWKRVIQFPPHIGFEHIAPEPRLGAAIRALSDAQRTSVVLVHAYQWTYAEVAETLGITEAAVTNHVHRGLVKLRKHLKVSI